MKIREQPMKSEVVRVYCSNGRSMYTVSIEGQIVGLLEKYHDVAGETHPWKAFSGCGMNVKFIGSFYQHEGGKSAAVQAVLSQI